MSALDIYVGLRVDRATGDVIENSVRRDADCGHSILISPAGVPLADDADRVLCAECAKAMIEEGATHSVVALPTVEQLDEIARWKRR